MIHYTLPHSSALYSVLGRLNTCTALRLCAVAQDDSDELLRLMILAVLAKADRPLEAEDGAACAWKRQRRAPADSPPTSPATRTAPPTRSGRTVGGEAAPAGP